MGIETERKFLVDWPAFLTHFNKRSDQKKDNIVQGYLSYGPVVRVRVVNDDEAYITVKGPGLMSRPEYDIPIPFVDGSEMIDKLCPAEKLIVKTRHHVVFDRTKWVVDQFHGHHRGLHMAEIELPQDIAYIAFPPWLEGEVTFDKAYSNAELSLNGLPKEIRCQE